MTENPFRWLHLSDFHVGKDQYGQCCLFKYILSNVQDAIDRGKPPHAIFITGDVANSGAKSEYETFVDEFFCPLDKLLLQTPGSHRIFLVPGNHDVTWSQARAVRTHGLLYHIPTLLDPTLQAQFDRTPLLPRFQAFMDNDMTSGSFQSHWISSSDGAMTSKIIFGTKQIGVLCLNSAWLSCEEDDRHNVSPGKGILEKGLADLQDAAVVFVLSHHPVEWFMDEEVSSIRSLLGKRPSVYLYGHLHKTSGSSQQIGTPTLLPIQAGAAFQAREDERWINRIVWGERDMDAGTVKVKPLLWSRDHQEWSIDTTAFPSELRVPGEDCWQFTPPSRNVATLASGTSGHRGTADVMLTLPSGWVSLNFNMLEEFKKTLTEEEIISFFDGRVPTWSDALSPDIPRRQIVTELIKQIDHCTKNSTITLFLLKGAGGEGKSTILRQVICDLLTNGIVEHVLWNENAEGEVPHFEQFHDLIGTYIIASDDAEAIGKEVFRLTKIASRTQKTGFCFLLACRDTDWISAGCVQLPWRNYTQMIDIPLRGLTREDAFLIIEAWGKQGARGLGRLYGQLKEDAVEVLLKEAKSEAYTEEGAFLGAMLRTRLGADLRAHVKSLLVNLGESKAPGGTLRYAFAHIAAPHAENTLILSKGVLAKALGCGRSELKMKILAPLGEEAVVAPTGSLVLTRHRAIAQATIDILSKDFHVDTDEIFLRLLEAALELSKQDVFVPNLGAWRYLSNSFLKRGKLELAVRLAQTAYDQDNENPFFIVQYAKMLRIASQPEGSVELFHKTNDYVKRDRTFYFEWGISEGVAGNRCNSILLAAMSLSDEGDRSWPNIEDATRAFAGMGTTFGRLYELYNDRRFIEACSATAQLGRSIKHNQEGAAYFDEAANLAQIAAVSSVPMPQAFARLKEGFIAAWERHETDLSRWLKPLPELNYSHLCELIHLAGEEGTSA